MLAAVNINGFSYLFFAHLSGTSSLHNFIGAYMSLITVGEFNELYFSGHVVFEYLVSVYLVGHLWL